MKYLVTFSFVALLAACTPKAQIGSPSVLDGTYTEVDSEQNSFVFKPNNTIETINKYSKKLKVTTYKIEGKKISFQFDGGIPGEMTMNDDGTLSLYGSTKYTKR